MRGNPALDDQAFLRVRIVLATADMQRAEGGLRLRETEEFVVGIPPLALWPPSVDVEHLRFADFPHVLQGYRLCLYLDPSREWDPRGGVATTIERLWDWLSDAAGARFDARTAMYHAVGGVLHRMQGTPAIVVRGALAESGFQVAHLVSRTNSRFDLRPSGSKQDSFRIPVIRSLHSLPLGAGVTLRGLMHSIDGSLRPAFQDRRQDILKRSPGALSALAAAAARRPPGSLQYFVLVVPHPMGGPDHLLAGRLTGSTADALRSVAKTHGPLADIDVRSIDPHTMIEWCNLSDERPVVTTRRDASRPVNGFMGKRVMVWGCGGLGSWAAEFVARAGAASILLCDPGDITGGLLVRQNYVESDIGTAKAESLAKRLRAIRDDIDVSVIAGGLPAGLTEIVKSVDVIIDATVSMSVQRCLESVVAIEGRSAVIAQMATDARSGSLGIMNVSCLTDSTELEIIDKFAGDLVASDPALESYRGLWQDPLSGDELVPTRGCSAPTFHGAATDLAAVAASLTSLLGLQLVEPVSGTHLVALPYAQGVPPHRFIPYGN